MCERNDSFEALFSVGGKYYIYVQYCDDSEYDFDYTVYDADLNDVDGGLIGCTGCADVLGGSWDLGKAAEEIVAEEKQIFGNADVVRLDLEEYRRRLHFDF